MMSDVSEFNKSIETLRYTCSASNYACRSYRLYREVAYESNPSTSIWATLLGREEEKKNLWLSRTLDTIFLDYDITSCSIARARLARISQPIIPTIPSVLSVFPDYENLRLIFDNFVNVSYGLRVYLWWLYFNGAKLEDFHEFRMGHILHHFQKRIPKLPVLVINDCVIAGATQDGLLFDRDENKCQIGVVFCKTSPPDLTAVIDKVCCLYVEVSPDQPLYKNFQYLRTDGDDFFEIEHGAIWPETSQ